MGWRAEGYFLFLPSYFHIPEIIQRALHVISETWACPQGFSWCGNTAEKGFMAGTYLSIPVPSARGCAVKVPVRPMSCARQRQRRPGAHQLRRSQMPALPIRAVTPRFVQTHAPGQGSRGDVPHQPCMGRSGSSLTQQQARGQGGDAAITRGARGHSRPGTGTTPRLAQPAQILHWGSSMGQSWPGFKFEITRS